MLSVESSRCSVLSAMNTWWRHYIQVVSYHTLVSGLLFINWTRTRMISIQNSTSSLHHHVVLLCFLVQRSRPGTGSSRSWSSSSVWPTRTTWTVSDSRCWFCVCGSEVQWWCRLSAASEHAQHENTWIKTSAAEMSNN